MWKKKKKKKRTQKDRQTNTYKNARARGSFAAGKQTDTHDSLFRWEEERLKQRRRNQCPCGALQKKTWEESCFCIPCGTGGAAMRSRSGDMRERRRASSPKRSTNVNSSSSSSSSITRQKREREDRAKRRVGSGVSDGRRAAWAWIR